MNPRIFLSPPHMSGVERDLIDEIFASNYVAPAGPMLERFEQDFCAATGIAHAVAVSSGTAAIHLALRLLNVGPGDEVWGPSLTFIGGVSPITFVGATPVFFDASPTDWGLDPELLADAMSSAAKKNKLPRAVISVDLYGQCADLDAIRAICDRYGVPVIVDAAESMGSSYRGRHAGKGAVMSAFSFNGNKIITSGGGGMFASDDEKLVAKARFLSQQAREPVIHYEHTAIGYNYRMSSLNAAVGCGQIGVLHERVARRRAIFEIYRRELGLLAGLTFMPEALTGRSNRWLSVMLISKDLSGVTPEKLRLALEAENIESRPVWKPMHMQPVFKAARSIETGVALQYFLSGLCLPSGSAMSDDDVERVIGVLRHTLVAN